MRITIRWSVPAIGPTNLRSRGIWLSVVIPLLFLAFAESAGATSPDAAHPADQRQTDASSPVATPPATPPHLRYLPLTEQGHSLPSSPRPLGTVRLISGPNPCDDQRCYELEVTCPELAEPRQATLKVGEPINQTHKGTILFATGWIGNSFWEVWSTNASVVLNELRMAGFRTVQLKWATNWFNGAPGRVEGHARLACRPATVMRWVHDNLHTSQPDTAFCAYGHSNGAAQVGFALAQYGMSAILSAVLLDGGPNWARTDKACLQDDPANQTLWFDDTERGIADWGFGFPNDGTGPCALKNTSYRDEFQEASVAFGDWEYIYPKTMVWFVQGALDQTTTATHGRFFYNHLMMLGSPLVRMSVVPGASHNTVSTTEGANTIRDILLNECRPR